MLFLSASWIDVKMEEVGCVEEVVVTVTVCDCLTQALRQSCRQTLEVRYVIAWTTRLNLRR